MPEIYSAKDPRETVVCSMDFTRVLTEAGLTTQDITDCQLEIRRCDGKPEDTTAMVVGAADMSALPVIKHKVTGGVHGVNYLVLFIMTAKGDTLIGSATMLVKWGGA